MVRRGYVKNGQVELSEALSLPDGTEVEIVVSSSIPNDISDENGPTLLERMKPFVGTVPDLPSDFSINHDHYLYGTPKRS